MNRRGFLQAILVAGVAPAFVGSSVLMPVRQLLPRSGLVSIWKRYGDGTTIVTYGPLDRTYGGLTEILAQRMSLVREMVTAGALGYRSIGSPAFNAKLLE